MPQAACLFRRRAARYNARMTWSRSSWRAWCSLHRAPLSLRLCTLFLASACDSGSSPSDDAGELEEAGEPADEADAGEDASTSDASSASDAGLDAAPEPVCDVVPPTSCPTPPVYYEDISPILMERCLSCHDGKGEQWPLTSYSHVTGWYNEIRAAMVTCSMPPADAGISMPAAEREKILTWILCRMPQRGDAGAGGH
jgi:hypothetical protein